MSNTMSKRTSKTEYYGAVDGLRAYAAIGNRNEGLLLNSYARFICNISVGIYLCHMMFYRILEKLHFIHLFKNEVISYIVATSLTIGMAIVFSCVVKRVNIRRGK